MVYLTAGGGVLNERGAVRELIWLTSWTANQAVAFLYSMV